jgi:hypothetical protein
MPDTQALTYAQEKDGAIAITVEGKPIRYVKEADLLAVKGGSENIKAEYESKLSEATKTLATLTTERDTTHANLLKEQAAHEAVKSQVATIPTYEAKLKDAAAKLLAAETSSKQLQDKLLVTVRTRLTAMGVQDKPLSELEAMESHISLVTKSVTRPANLGNDRGNGGGGSAAPETRLERARRVLETAHYMGAAKSK